MDYLANATSGGLTSTNSTVSYGVSWADAGGTIREHHDEYYECGFRLRLSWNPGDVS